MRFEIDNILGAISLVEKPPIDQMPHEEKVRQAGSVCKTCTIFERCQPKFTVRTPRNGALEVLGNQGNIGSQDCILVQSGTG